MLEKIAATLSRAVQVWAQMQHDAKQAVGYGAEFAVFFHRGLDRLAASDMTPRDFQALFWMLSRRRLQWLNYGDVSTTELAADLKCSQATAARALQSLTKVGVIERENRGGAGKVARYRLNPYYAWRGGAAQYHDTVMRRGREPKPIDGAPDDPAQQPLPLKPPASR